MEKMKRAVKLLADRTLEENIHDYLIGLMKFYHYYAIMADREAKKPDHKYYNRPEWIYLVERQQWRDAIELAFRQGLIDSYDLHNFVMLRPNGDIIGPKPIEG